MPCDSGPDPNYKDDRLERATQAACEMSKLLNEKQSKALSRQTQFWIAEHDAIDRERIARELKSRKEAELRKQALSKLSPEEKTALGFTKHG